MKATKVSKELVNMLNEALEQEHAAYAQYLSFAELIEGPYAEPLMERLKEIAEDEAGHQKKLRGLIADHLGAVPSTGTGKTYPAKTTEGILQVSLKEEQVAVDFYTKILEKIKEEKGNLPYSFWTLEHEVRHIIIDEQEHIAELKRLLAQSIR